MSPRWTVKHAETELIKRDIGEAPEAAMREIKFLLALCATNYQSLAERESGEMEPKSRNLKFRDNIVVTREDSCSTQPPLLTSFREQSKKPSLLFWILIKFTLQSYFSTLVIPYLWFQLIQLVLKRFSQSMTVGKASSE